jgi:hypothetical protein
VRVKKLATLIAAKSPLATQREYQGHENAADYLRRDGIILRPRNLVSRAPLATNWTLQSHETLAHKRPIFAISGINAAANH